MKYNVLKRTLAGVLAVLCVAAYAPANVGTGGLFGSTAITASATDVVWDDDVDGIFTIDGDVTVRGEEEYDEISDEWNSYHLDVGDNQKSVIVINGSLIIESGDLGIDNGSVVIVNGDVKNTSEHNYGIIDYEGKVIYTGTATGTFRYDTAQVHTDLTNISYDSDTGLFTSGGKNYNFNGSELVEVEEESTEQTLSNGKYVQTATQNGTFYTRYVFVKPKSEIEGKSKGVFTAKYNGNEKTFETSTYYTELTTGGISYTPESEESVIFVVTITGVPADQIATVEDDPATTTKLTCELSFEDSTQEGESVAVTGIELDKETLELTAGGDTATLNATVSPDDATDKTVTWTSSNENVATVENGVVTPVGAGSATITAKAGDKIATCTVSVKQKYSITLTGPYSGETLVVEYYEGDTWNDMVAKYPSYIKVYSGYAAFYTDGFIHTKSGNMVSSTAKIDPNETYTVE